MAKKYPYSSIAKERKGSKLSEKFTSLPPEASSFKTNPIIFCGNSDVGVQRNLGRLGARFASQAILSELGKMSPLALPELEQIGIVHLIDQLEQEVDYEASNNLLIDRLQGHITDWSEREQAWVYLGGGHDHIYPLLSALSRCQKDIMVINIDPHFDSRTDDHLHSGTPFLKFSQEHRPKPNHFQLFHLGIHHFANTLETASSIGEEHMDFLSYDQLRDVSKQFISTHAILDLVEDKIKERFKGKPIIVLSLDVDCIDGAQMPGVSAVNHFGLSKDFVSQLLNDFYSRFAGHGKILGIYEYNPLFDTKSNLGARYLAYLIERFLKACLRT
jgi:arginase family enzyme